MKLKEGFLIHNTGDEQVIVGTGDVSFNGLVRSNSTAAFIVECLQENTTQAQIVAKLLEKYDAPESVIASDVSKIIDKLRSIGALYE